MNNGNDIEYIKKRAKYFSLLFIVLFAIAVWEIISTQINPPDRAGVRVYTESIEARRGSILATDGRPLAVSIPYYQIRMDCVAPDRDTFRKHVGALSSKLAELYGDKSAAQYRRELENARKKNSRYKAIGNRTIDYSELEELKKFPIFRLGANRGGLIVEEKSKRNNPYGRLAYRTIGYVNSVGEGVGIELTYDEYLRGTPGSRKMQKVIGGWKPVDISNIQDPVDGIDIRTTIDIEIQEAAERALREQLSKDKVFEGATAIVMEVKTGAVRAIVNMKRTSDGRFDESFNYAIGQPSEPGSTFKLVTLISLLEDGYVDLDTPVDVGNGRFTYFGHTYADVGRGLGLTDVRTAFEHSSNVAFVKLALEHYGKTGREKDFVDRIVNMRVTEKLTLDIMAEGRTRMLDPGEKAWNKLTLPSMAMGYAIDITPLHTLNFYNAVANGGVMMKPYFIESMEKDGKVIRSFPPQKMMGAICSKKTIKTAKEALVSVVSNGGAKKYNDSRYQIAGKTGTARILLENGRYVDKDGYRRHQASFAGFFPADDPKYSAIVVLYTGKTRQNFYGGAWAAPVFKSISDQIYATHYKWNDPIEPEGRPADNPEISSGIAEKERLAVRMLPMSDKPDVPRTGVIKMDCSGDIPVCTEIDTDPDRMPDVTGMGIRDALYILENSGWKVSFSGFGNVVEQTPSPGTPSAEAGKKAVLKLGLEKTGKKK